MATELKERLENPDTGAQFLVKLKQSISDFKEEAKQDMKRIESSRHDDYGDGSTTTPGTKGLGRRHGSKRPKKKGPSDDGSNDLGSDDDQQSDDDSSRTWRLQDAESEQDRKESKEKKRKEMQDTSV